MDNQDQNMGPLSGTFDEAEDKLSDAREQVGTIDVQRQEFGRQETDDTQDGTGLTTGDDMGTASGTGG